MRNARSALSLAVAALLLLSTVSGMVSVAAAASSPPSGMVAVADSQVQDLRPRGVETTISEADLEDAVYVSAYASTTKVSLVTGAQATAVAHGVSPSAVAQEQVCSTPAAAKNPTFDCAESTFALVLSDAVHDAGRRVAIRASTVRTALGYLPNFVTVRNNETGERWQYPATVKNGWLLVRAQHFSSNAVTWTGEITINASPATDGTTWSYQVSDMDATSDPVLKMTGVRNSEWDNVSATAVSDGGTVNLNIAGNAPPTGPSKDNEPEITFIGRSQVDGFEDGDVTEWGGDTGSFSATTSPVADGSYAGKLSNGGTSGSAIVHRSLSSIHTGTVNVSTKLRFANAGGDAEFVSLTNGTTDTSGIGPQIGASSGEWVFVNSSGTQYTGVSVNSGTWYRVKLVIDVPSQTYDLIVNGTTIASNVGFRRSVSDIELIRLSEYGDSLFIDTIRDQKAKNVTIDVNGDGIADASFSGALSYGESVTLELSNTTTTTDSGTVHLDTGKVDIKVDLKERTVTKDPGVGLNAQSGGGWSNVSGTLNDGETVTRTLNASWLQEGTNNLTVTLPSLSADAPAMQVGLAYNHSITSKKTVTYASQEWTDRYNVSKTFAGERSQATLSIGFEHNVIEIRQLEYRINGSGDWAPVSVAHYTLSSNDLSVDLDEIYGGTIPANTKIAIRTDGSKVETHNMTISVVEATDSASKLDSKIAITSMGTDGWIGVGPTEAGQRIHYTYKESWSSPSDYAVVAAGGSQHLHLPHAEQGDTARVTYVPVSVAPSSGDMRVAVPDAGASPTIDVGPSGEVSPVSYTFYDTQSGVKYLLYSVTDKIVRDSAVADSPVVLEGDDSDELLEIMPESSGTTDDGDDGGVVDRIRRVAPGQFAQDAGGLGTLTYGAIALLGLVGVGYIYRRTRGPTTRSQRSSITGRLASGVASTLGSGVSALVENPRATAGLAGLGLVSAIATGVIRLPPGAGQLLVVAGILMGVYVAQRQFGGEDVNLAVFGTFALVATILSLQLLGGDVVATVLEKLGPVLPLLALGALALAWQTVKAWRAPEKQTSLIIRAYNKARNK